MKDLVIIGAGGNGCVIADIAKSTGVYNKIYFLDDNKKDCVMGISIVGTTADVKKYVDTCDIFVSIGDNKIRGKFISNLLDMGASIPTLIHSSAIVGTNVKFGVGTAVMAGAVINCNVAIGKGVIVNTCASIDHDSFIGDFCHIAVGARIAGTVIINERCFVGAGAVTKNNVSICADCVVGAGAVIVKNIEEKGTYVGVPAKRRA